VVVQHVDAEEQEDIDQPPPDGDAILFQEERRPCSVKLRREPDGGDEEELDECEECSFKSALLANYAPSSPVEPFFFAHAQL
jgi:hypothetical protein